MPRPAGRQIVDTSRSKKTRQRNRSVQRPLSLAAPQLSIVVPVFNESGNIDVLVAALTKELDALDLSSEIILVDDGSRDGTWAEVTAAAAAHARVRGLSLSRNFGHQNALFAGLHFAGGQAIITMDGDLQHPPSLIPRMVAEWQAGRKVVETSRQDSQDTTAFKRASSRWFYKLFSWLSGIPVAKGSSDFRLVDRQVVKAMTEMRDADLFLRGMTYWVGAFRAPPSATRRRNGTPAPPSTTWAAWCASPCPRCCPFPRCRCVWAYGWALQPACWRLRNSPTSSPSSFAAVRFRAGPRR